MVRSSKGHRDMRSWTAEDPLQLVVLGPRLPGFYRYLASLIQRAGFRPDFSAREKASYASRLIHLWEQTHIKDIIRSVKQCYYAQRHAMMSSIRLLFPYAHLRRGMPVV